MALGTSHPIEPYFLPFKLGMKAGEGVGFVYFLTLLTHQLLCLRNNHNVNLKYSGIRKHWGFTCPSEGVSVVSKVNGLCFPRVVILNHIYDCLCYWSDWENSGAGVWTSEIFIFPRHQRSFLKYLLLEKIPEWFCACKSLLFCGWLQSTFIFCGGSNNYAESNTRGRNRECGTVTIWSQLWILSLEAHKWYERFYSAEQ